jgi:ADP-L-glycero-D-manno-heptose 6-epimerase
MAKFLAEQYLRYFWTTMKVPTTSVRIFNVYGPRETHKLKAASMIFQLYAQMKGGRRPRVFKSGEQKRDFVYVKDVVAETIAGLGAPKTGVYNAGSGKARSFNDIIAILNRELGTDLEPDYFDNPYAFYQSYTQADMSRAQRDLKFSPQFTLELGIADYVRELRGQGAGGKGQGSGGKGQGDPAPKLIGKPPKRESVPSF